MKDQYVADVGDFGKYGLLRWLTGCCDHGPKLELGIIWFRTTNDSKPDGKFLNYLEPERSARFECCDIDCFNKLKNLKRDFENDLRKRSLEEIVARQILPHGTKYFLDYVPKEVAKRRDWLSTAIRRLVNSELIFIDPDNGLEVPSASVGTSDGEKYVFYHELRELRRRSQTLIIYHHLCRHSAYGCHEAQVESRKKKLHRILRLPVAAVRFRRGSSRAFFIAFAERHEELLENRLHALLSSHWGSGKQPHFTRP